MNYAEAEPEFYKYLTESENITKNTKTNYISWLRFLSQFHTIDDQINEPIISKILDYEGKIKTNRNIYTKEKDISNFKSALNKYLKFINDDFNTKLSLDCENKINEIKNNNFISITEKENLTLARVGQGKYRNELIKYWTGCSITKFNKINLLIASHIKPWRESNNIERLDVYNGLLLLPNYDKLFDKGYINFDYNGKIIISKFLNPDDNIILGINPSLTLVNVEEKHKYYLDYHYRNCFIK